MTEATAIASFRRVSPAILASARMAMANDIPDTSKSEISLLLKKAAPILGIDGTTYHALMPFELIVIGFPAILDRVDKRNQSSVCPMFWASDFSASARQSLPFPSSNGRMLSQYKWPTPARVRSGKGS